MKIFNILLISFAEFIKLIEVIIWPITLLLALLFFRRNLAGIISNLGSVKAGASGFEMTFQEKLSSVADLIEGDVAGRSKSASEISIEVNGYRSPYKKLLHIRDNLSAKIYKISLENNIVTEDQSVKSLIDRLKDSGAITIQNSRRLNAFVDLTQSAHQSITENEFKRVQDLYNQLTF